ncbi:MAG: hypothetical protein EBZ48_01390 [Proteobacteria bacterium]|nr:hypothetical protein [Pseudomonadota bacterium]
MIPGQIHAGAFGEERSPRREHPLEALGSKVLLGHCEPDSTWRRSPCSGKNPNSFTRAEEGSCGFSSASLLTLTVQFFFERSY